MRVLCDVHMLSLFDAHLSALAQLLAHSPCYIELGSEGIVTFETPA